MSSFKVKSTYRSRPKVTFWNSLSLNHYVVPTSHTLQLWPMSWQSIPHIHTFVELLHLSLNTTIHHQDWSPSQLPLGHYFQNSACLYIIYLLLWNISHPMTRTKPFPYSKVHMLCDIFFGQCLGQELHSLQGCETLLPHMHNNINIEAWTFFGSKYAAGWEWHQVVHIMHPHGSTVACSMESIAYTTPTKYEHTVAEMEFWARICACSIFALAVTSGITVSEFWGWKNDGRLPYKYSLVYQYCNCASWNKRAWCPVCVATLTASLTVHGFTHTHSIACNFCIDVAVATYRLCIKLSKPTAAVQHSPISVFTLQGSRSINASSQIKSHCANNLLSGNRTLLSFCLTDCFSFKLRKLLSKVI